MFTYKLEFFGRTVGSIGICYLIQTEIVADSDKEMEEKLYQKYEHISDFKSFRIRN